MSLAARTLFGLLLLAGCAVSEDDPGDACRNALPFLVSAGRYSASLAEGAPPDLARNAEVEVAPAENTVRVTYRDATGRLIVDSYRITRRETR